MLILKGKKQKTVVVNSIMESNDSILMYYNDYRIDFESEAALWVNKSQCSIDEFFKEAENWMKNSGEHKFFILYTNEKERDLKEWINWLYANERFLPCNQVILTCR